jgi:putative membrane protein
MKIRNLALLSAATLALAACGHKTDTVDVSNNTTIVDSETNDTMMSNDATADNGMAPAATGGQAFANTAAASDAFEIASSKAALDMSKSASVKKFAQKMIDAHTESTAKLKTITAGLSPAITPDPTLTPDQQTQIDAMKKLSGTDFDKAYIDAQAAGHQQTLDALKSYAASGDVPALKTFATNLVPIVAAHLNMAKGLKA